MNEAIYKIKEQTIKDIANAIRAKAGKNNLISPLDMAEEILNLPLGDIDFSQQTATEDNVEEGYTFFNKYGLLSTGTGGGTNYEIVGGTTQPVSPKENTIWINTDMEIGEYEFSHTHSGVLKDNVKTSKATSTIIFHANTTSLTTQAVGRSALLECLPNTKYKIHKSAGNLWYIATTQEAPANGVAINILKSVEDSSNTINITTGPNANHLVVFVSNASVEPDITLTCLDTIDTRIDGSDLQNGDIWLVTGAESDIEFNALKKNGIELKVIGAYQWNGTEWEEKTVNAYTGGEWYTRIRYLYKNGVFLEPVITNIDATAESYYQQGARGYINAGDDYIQLYLTDRRTNANLVFPKIDMTPYSKLVCKVTAVGTLHMRQLAVSTTTATYDSKVAYKACTVGTIEVDLSSVTGEHYPNLHLLGNNGSSGGDYINFSEIYLV